MKKITDFKGNTEEETTFMIGMIEEMFQRAGEDRETLAGIKTTTTTHQVRFLINITVTVSHSIRGGLIDGSMVLGATLSTDTTQSTENMDTEIRWTEISIRPGITSKEIGSMIIKGISVLVLYYVRPFIRLTDRVAPLSDYPLYLIYLAS